MGRQVQCQHSPTIVFHKVTRRGCEELAVPSGSVHHEQHGGWVAVLWLPVAHIQLHSQRVLYDVYSCARVDLGAGQWEPRGAMVVGSNRNEARQSGLRHVAMLDGLHGMMHVLLVVKGPAGQHLSSYCTYGGVESG
jgi:hypothetical protein